MIYNRTSHLNKIVSDASYVLLINSPKPFMTALSLFSVFSPTIYHPLLFFHSISLFSFTCRPDWWLSGPDFSGPPSSSSWWPLRCMWVTPESLITSTTGATCWWGCCRERLSLCSMWVSETTSFSGNCKSFYMIFPWYKISCHLFSWSGMKILSCSNMEANFCQFTESLRLHLHQEIMVMVMASNLITS